MYGMGAKEGATKIVGDATETVFGAGDVPPGIWVSRVAVGLKSRARRRHGPDEAASGRSRPGGISSGLGLSR